MQSTPLGQRIGAESSGDDNDSNQRVPTLLILTNAENNSYVVAQRQSGRNDETGGSSDDFLDNTDLENTHQPIIEHQATDNDSASNAAEDNAPNSLESSLQARIVTQRSSAQKANQAIMQKSSKVTATTKNNVSSHFLFFQIKNKIKIL